MYTWYCPSALPFYLDWTVSFRLETKHLQMYRKRDNFDQMMITRLQCIQNIWDARCISLCLTVLTFVMINNKVHPHCILQAYHFGNHYLVEIHIVLPEDMTVKEAHEIEVSIKIVIYQPIAAALQLSVSLQCYEPDLLSMYSK